MTAGEDQSPPSTSLVTSPPQQTSSGALGGRRPSSSSNSRSRASSQIMTGGEVRKNANDNTQKPTQNASSSTDQNECQAVGDQNSVRIEDSLRVDVHDTTSEGKERRVKLSIFSGDFFNLSQSSGTDLIPEVLIHKEDLPEVQPGDVIQIYHPPLPRHSVQTDHSVPSDDVDFRPRVLMKVEARSIYPDNGVCKPVNKDTIYLDKAVAEVFGLQNFQDVIVSKVNPETNPWGIALDSVVLTFKEQYLGRSDMWRLRNRLADTTVYINKHIEFCQGDALRCQVNELWANGDRVASGLINSDTKIVFRSQSAMVYLFIQMSSEMWMHDKNGYLYFEKTVDGFLKEMFQRWKEVGSSHEVTVVLFTRVFYDATSREEFPQRMLECIQVGYDGSFYEDFYHVLVQNERFEDWMPTITTLKHTFPTYKEDVLNYHTLNRPPAASTTTANITDRSGGSSCTDGHQPPDDDDKPIPKASIAPASRGNFLEVLNMSLNTFENHYLSRNLDRTGQQSIVITPGVGIFQVDAELQKITKRRIIDSGVGSDLICVGEQPLHAVPLLELHSPDSATKGDSSATTDSRQRGPDYRMPHWLNLSFYDSPDSTGYRSRINCPPSIDRIVNGPHVTRVNCSVGCCRAGATSDFRPQVTAPSERKVPAINGAVSNRRNVLPCSRIREEEGSLENNDRPDNKSVGGNGDEAETEEDEEEQMLREFEEYDEQVFKVPTLKRSWMHGFYVPPPPPPTHNVASLATPSRSAQSTLQRQHRRGAGQSSGGTNGRKMSEPDVLNQSSFIAGISSGRSAGGGGFNHLGITIPNNEVGGSYDVAMASSLTMTHSQHMNSTLACQLISSSLKADKTWPSGAVSGAGDGTGANGVDGTGALGKSETGGGAGTATNKNLTIADETFDHEAIKQYLLRPSRILVNPFDPSYTTERVTSARRRWTHIFPHNRNAPNPLLDTKQQILDKIAYGDLLGAEQIAANASAGGVLERKNSTNAWTEVFGSARADPAEPWYSAPHGGVDWKSLTIPASFPITTDYVPDDKELINDYYFNEYQIVPEDILAEATQQRSPLTKPQLSNEEVFAELISQRLAQGFQLIVKDNQHQFVQKGVTPLQQPRKISENGGENGTSVGVGSLQLASPAAAPVRSLSYSSPRSFAGGGGGRKSIMNPVKKPEPSAVHWLSIGTIFHKVTLSADKRHVEIMRYRPKEGSSNLSFHYRYRFQAPDNDNYEVSWVDFRTEKLENFNWNHMDYYVCTRGDKEYLLTENLKYWRYRLYVLPLAMYQPYTKKILDGSSDRCDIYPPSLLSGHSQYNPVDLVESFMKFVETCINGAGKGLRRASPSEKAKANKVKASSVQPQDKKTTSPGGPGTGGHSEFRVRSATTAMMDRSKLMNRRPLQTSKRVRHESGGGAGGLNLLPTSPQPQNPEVITTPSRGNDAETASVSFDAMHSPGGPSSLDPATQGTLLASNSADFSHASSEAVMTSDDKPELSLSHSSHLEIVEAMKGCGSGGRYEGKGLNFFNNIKGLPEKTFLAFEAVVWLKSHVSGVETYVGAVELLHDLLDKRLICHASGEVNHQFDNGFFLFAITSASAQSSETGGNNKRFTPPYRGDLETFKNDWVEIRVRAENMDIETTAGASISGQKTPEVPEFLKPDMRDFDAREKLRRSMSVNNFYRSATFDVAETASMASSASPSSSSKAGVDRKEWWHLQYQQQYEPDSAFELALQWSVATGALIGKMVLNWARKGCQMGLSVIPVPHDPFALPITLNSDPVRGPIFIQLDTRSLQTSPDQMLFDEFDRTTWEQRTFLFREEIAKRFGFVVTCIAPDRQQSSDLFSTDRQYIHCTGNMFLLIPTRLQLQTGIQGIRLRPQGAGIGLAVSREKSSEASQQKVARKNASSIFKQVASKTEGPLPDQPEEISRHLSEHRPAYDHSETGFLWSWNFTVSKRWKQVSNTGATGDIRYMDKMLADFRDFCSNKNGRLKQFWDDCWDLKNASNSQSGLEEE